MVLLLLKKLIARLLFPVPFLLLTFTAGAFLMMWPKLGPRCRAAGRALLLSGIVLLFIGSVLGQHWLHTLTKVYLPLDPDGLPAENYTLVVAGHGFHAEQGVPPERWFDDEMQLRLHEAARVARTLEQRQIPYRLVASIAGRKSASAKREALEAFLGHYGVPAEKISFIDDALNSRQEVLAFKKEPGRKILISGSYHMPRLMALSKQYELDAIPAPATRIGCGGFGGALSFVPSAENLYACERAVYEYLGMLEYMLF
ncbi:MAG: YdcF family protein [Lentisphaeria bacterium]|nr:YdcF family protein [Lentisphaeria bacterium]